MKTFIYTTLSQFVFVVVIAIFLLALTFDVEGYQVQYITLSSFELLLPLAVYNFLGLGLVYLSLRLIRSVAPKKIVWGTLISLALLVTSVIFILTGSSGLTFPEVKFNPFEAFLLQLTLYLIMSLILAVYYIKFNREDLDDDRVPFQW